MGTGNANGPNCRDTGIPRAIKLGEAAICRAGEAAARARTSEKQAESTITQEAEEKENSQLNAGSGHSWGVVLADKHDMINITACSCCDSAAVVRLVPGHVSWDGAVVGRRLQHGIGTCHSSRSAGAGKAGST